MEKTKAYLIAKEKMYDQDAFSQWLGIRIEEIEEGRCKLTMEVRPEMTNGMKIAHGGISYSLADSAFAFASNSYGRVAVSVETSISHLKPIFSGDHLTAVASLVSLGHKIAVYSIVIHNQNDLKVAHFKGTVYRKEKEWK